RAGVGGIGSLGRRGGRAAPSCCPSRAAQRWSGRRDANGALGPRCRAPYTRPAVATAELSADAAAADGVATRSSIRTWPTTLALLALFALLVGPALAWVYRPLLSGGFFLSDDHFLLREATAQSWRPWPTDPWLLTGVRHPEMWRPLGL